ncbi:hypothetical protein Hanom_Chr10g00913591 [Helianthus anomalus]
MNTVKIYDAKVVVSLAKYDKNHKRFIYISETFGKSAWRPNESEPVNQNNVAPVNNGKAPMNHQPSGPSGSTIVFKGRSLLICSKIRGEVILKVRRPLVSLVIRVSKVLEIWAPVIDYDMSREVSGWESNDEDGSTLGDTEEGEFRPGDGSDEGEGKSGAKQSQETEVMHCHNPDHSVHGVHGKSKSAEGVPDDFTTMVSPEVNIGGSNSGGLILKIKMVIIVRH